MFACLFVLCDFLWLLNSVSSATFIFVFQTNKKKKKTSKHELCINKDGNNCTDMNLIPFFTTQHISFVDCSLLGLFYELVAY